ncbi:hypothetical protein VP01_1680g2 [Puccinia sorghi]|uniref:Uncharacterized protein n=1 Tax=Puccinia sorghi TaxID=27349 RepID=A0A0L6VG01_9BASI|nr:hypothetical protein VP01_1680g2 [Puccinia sorghi]
MVYSFFLPAILFIFGRQDDFLIYGPARSSGGILKPPNMQLKLCSLIMFFFYEIYCWKIKNQEHISMDDFGICVVGGIQLLNLLCMKWLRVTVDTLHGCLNPALWYFLQKRILDHFFTQLISEIIITEPKLNFKMIVPVSHVLCNIYWLLDQLLGHPQLILRTSKPRQANLGEYVSNTASLMSQISTPAQLNLSTPTSQNAHNTHFFFLLYNFLLPQFYSVFFSLLSFFSLALQKKKLAQLPAVDMWKVPGSFCCYYKHSPQTAQWLCQNIYICKHVEFGWQLGWSMLHINYRQLSKFFFAVFNCLLIFKFLLFDSGNNFLACLLANT